METTKQVYVQHAGQTIHRYITTFVYQNQSAICLWFAGDDLLLPSFCDDDWYGMEEIICKIEFWVPSFADATEEQIINAVEARLKKALNFGEGI